MKRLVNHGRVGLRVCVCVTVLVAVFSVGLSVVNRSRAGASTTTAATFVSEAGDWVGQGATYSFPTVTYKGLRGGYPMFSVSGGNDQFDVWFAAPAGQPLAPGTYDDAERFDFRSPGFPGLDVFGDGRGCNVVEGSFTIYNATYDSSGNVLSFSAQFFDHCEGGYPALMGNLSYNTATPPPPLPASAPEPPQSAQIDSQTGDSIGQGQQDAFSIASPATFNYYTGSGALLFDLSNEANSTPFQVNFDPPTGGDLAVGTYTNSQPDSSAGFGIAGPFGGCGATTWSFTIYAISYDALGVLQSFAAEFTDHCPGEVPALFGLIRYNSDVTMPPLPTPSTPTPPVISNMPPSGTVGAGFLASVTTSSDGTTSVVSSSTNVCTVGADGLTVHYVGLGLCSLTPKVASSFDYVAASGSAQSVTVTQGTPTTPFVSNLPSQPTFGTSFTAFVATSGDGTKTVTTNSPAVCTVGSNGLMTFFVGVGECSLTAHVTAGTNYTGSDGNVQTSLIGKAAATPPVISDLPAQGTVGGSFVASVTTTGDGTRSVTSNTPEVCTVGPDGLTVDYVGTGTCSLSPRVAGGTDYSSDDGNAQAFAINPLATPPATNPTTPPAPVNPITSPSTAASHGYWLVGSDGGIFSFGSAQFYGSMGGQTLQRPVVGIVPTADRGGYWLDASDGGVFSFGDTRFYGSVPGLGLHPAGSGLPNSLAAPIVGMVPSHDQGGYFMVASDGGVFAFGDATFAGSCPGIGGCAGAAVAVMPDSTGKGYWLVTATGNVYTFGDAPRLGDPGPQSSPVTSSVATPDGKGYWILDADGKVFAYGDASNDGSPPSANFNAFDPANAVFTTSDGDGYWVVDAAGKVFAFGDAPNAGDVSGTHLNGSIIGASGS